MAKLRIQNRFGVIPNELLHEKTISLKAKGLFAYMQSKPDDWEFSSERMTADHADGRDGIRAALKELEQKGYLIREKRRDGTGKFEMDYLLCETPNQPDTATEYPSPTATAFPTPEKPTPENPASNKESSIKKEIVKKNLFDDFWNIYPKKEGKLAAEKAFAKLKDKNQEAAIATIPAHTAYWRKKYGEPNKAKFSTLYVPHPGTWLNGRRWEDILDPIIPPAKKPTAVDFEEARKKEEHAAKIRASEDRERQEQQRKENQAKADKAQALAEYKKLTPETQRQIADKADEALAGFAGTKEKFPEQYRMLRESKIIALLGTLQPTI